MKGNFLARLERVEAAQQSGEPETAVIDCEHTILGARPILDASGEFVRNEFYVDRVEHKYVTLPYRAVFPNGRPPGGGVA